MSTSTHSIDDLRNPRNDRFHEVDWNVQRLFRLIILLLLVAGLLGWFGQGPTVWTTVLASDQSVAVEYYAIERYASPTLMVIRLRDKISASQPIEVRFSRNFCDRTKPESITPEPLHQRLEGDDIVYTFLLENATRAEIVYRYQHEGAGRLAYEVALAGHAPVPVSQLVLP